MKKSIVLFVGILFAVFSSCSHTGGKAFSKWDIKGNAVFEDGTFTLTGIGSEVFIEGDDYKDFDLNMKVRTTNNGKGFVSFHTRGEGEGYKIAINNDMQDSIWWRRSGSLMSVRNIVKSFAKENEWFDLNIRVEGQLITVEINETLVVEYIEPANPFRNEANSKMLLSEGTFNFVSTSEGTLEFKDIDLTVLDRKDINVPAQLEVARDEQSDDIIRLHQEDFPVLDYHVHLKGGLTKEAAIKQSRKTGINYAVAPNCGIGFQIISDEQIRNYLDTMRSQPFILAMQGEGREWVKTFSQEARDEFDFVFTDALTFTDHKGRRVRLWINDEVIIDIDKDKYMDMIVDKTCDVLQEPANIFVNPFFLPEELNDRYDELWTDKRIDKVIAALVKSGEALEINELYQIPSKTILMKAKDAGIKFTFGSNNVTPDVSKLEYSIKMKTECGLTPQDMYKPKIKLN